MTKHEDSLFSVLPVLHKVKTIKLSKETSIIPLCMQIFTIANALNVVDTEGIYR